MNQAVKRLPQIVAACLMPAMLAAIAALVLGIGANLAIDTWQPKGALKAAFDSGLIESRTPFRLAPWRLKTRAQADCRQMQRPLLSDRTPMDLAVTPRYLTDRSGDATACELLAADVIQPANARIGHVSKSVGVNVAGPIALAIVAALGWAGAGWLHLALYILVALVPFGLVMRRGPIDLARVRVLAGFIATAMLLAVPGSISLLPVSAVLLLIAAAPVLCERQDWWEQRAHWLAATVAATLMVLDPSAAAANAGLALLIAILTLHYRAPLIDDPRRPIAAYVLAMIAVGALYIVLAIATAKPASTTALAIIGQALGDQSVEGWFTDLPPAFARLAQWLGDGPLYDPTVAFAFLWTIPCAVMAWRPASPDAAVPVARSAFARALAPQLPLLVWVLLYPGLLRRAADNYALIPAVAGGIAFAMIWERIAAAFPQAGRRRASAKPTPRTSQAA